MSERREFYRKPEGRLLFGLCSGLGEYLQVEPNIIRVVWVAFSVIVPGGILLYLLAPLVVPLRSSDEPVVSPLSRNHLLALLFVGVGVLLLVSQYHFWDERWFNLISIPLDAFLAVILIVTGMLIFFMGGIRRDPMYFAIEGERRLFRSLSQRKLLGVCGGIATYFNFDPSLVRLFFVAGTLISIWLGLCVYIILALLIPLQPEPPLTEEEESAFDSTDSQSHP
ncbi:MAG: PspC domain-containing protein [Candidatus Delongbacteria bacterium]|nr:PspC domain-containing protein [Candidatus Delongbacteria bacterium]